MVETLLEVRNLSKTFRYRTGLFHRQTVEAVKPLSFTLREKQTLAIIGENGSGKSTLAKMLAGMVEPSGGEILIDDHPLEFGDYSFRSQRIRMIFQDPRIDLGAPHFRDSLPGRDGCHLSLHFPGRPPAHHFFEIFAANPVVAGSEHDDHTVFSCALFGSRHSLGRLV